jgi:hypothetical protein
MSAAENPEPRGRLVDMSWEQYLADKDRWSNTSLGNVLEKGPRYAFMRWTGQIEDKDTPAMQLGRVVHTAIWEGTEAFAAKYLVADRRTTKGKAAAAEHEERGGEVITGATYDKAMQIGMAVLKAANERANDTILVNGEEKPDTLLRDILAAPGRREQSFTWEDSVTGLPLKGRADKLFERVPVIADLKTASEWMPDWKQWVRGAKDRGYHRQAWLYCDAYEAIYGVRPRFICIVVHSAEPYEVALCEFGDAELELGMLEARRAMRRVLDCMESGRWYDPAERGVVQVTFPHYVFSDEELAG